MNNNHSRCFMLVRGDVKFCVPTFALCQQKKEVGNVHPRGLEYSVRLTGCTGWDLLTTTWSWTASVRKEINLISSFSSMGPKDNNNKKIIRSGTAKGSSERNHDLVPNQYSKEVLRSELILKFLEYFPGISLTYWCRNSISLSDRGRFPLQQQWGDPNLSCFIELSQLVNLVVTVEEPLFLPSLLTFLLYLETAGIGVLSSPCSHTSCPD